MDKIRVDFCMISRILNDSEVSDLNWQLVETFIDK